MVFEWFKSKLGIGSGSKTQRKRNGKEVAFRSPSRENEVGGMGRPENPERIDDKFLYRQRVHKVEKPRYGYKATRNGLLRVIVPEGAHIVVSNTPTVFSKPNKLRTNKLYVDEIVQVTTINPRAIELDPQARTSLYTSDYRYEEGELHRPHNGFDMNADVTCSGGLHFFPKASDARRWFESYEHIHSKMEERRRAEERVKP